MKTKLFFTFLITTAIIVGFSCKKEEDKATLPKLTTSSLTEITDTSATTGGTITSDGGTDIVSSGVCYSTTENPTIANDFTTDIAANGTFTSKLKGLKGGRNYYIRAYATNSVGTSYGQSVQLTTVLKNQTISMGANYASDVYYSFKNGIIASVPRTNWDIAFSVSTQSASIIINESAGVILKKLPNTWSWDTPVDTTGFNKEWAALHNSNTTWEDGAFNQAATGGFNYGWGDYNTSSHNVIGVTKYIIKLRDGSYKKIFIELKQSALQKYDFRYANIDGTSPIIITNLSAVGSKANYIYYNLVDNSVLTSREPDATTWDIVFTQWLNSSIGYYPVTGVLQNIETSAISLTVSDPLNIVYNDADFSKNINTVGSGWKSYSGGVYTVPTNKVYIVKDRAGRVYQINFLSFAGGSTGNLSFNIKQR